MFKNLKAFLFLGMALSAKTLFAQQNSGGLQQLWEEVKTSYPGVKVGEHKIISAEKNQNAVLGERLPQFRSQAQNSYATHEGTAGAFFPQSGLFNVSGSDALTGAEWNPNVYASATMEFEVFSFGKMRHKSRAAEAFTNKTKDEQEAYLLNLQKELSARYLDVLFNHTRLESNRRNVERLKTVRTITSALAGAGLKTAADSLLAASSHNQALGENENLLGKHQAALIKLQELSGNANNPYQESIPLFLDPKTMFSETILPQSHPFLNALEQDRQRLESLSKSESGAALPSLKLLGGYAYRGTGIGNDGFVSDKWKDGFSNAATNGLVGIGLTWNISDLYTQKQKSNSLKEQAESQKYVYEQYEKQWKADLASAENQIKNQFSEVQKTKEAEAQAESAYEMYLARYKSGLMDLSSLLQIQLLLEQAEKTHIRASYEYWMLLATQAELLGDFDFLFNNL